MNISYLRTLPIESIAERLGLSVNQHKSICPFHQDHHPSLNFNLRRNNYHCYACGAHGGVIDLAMHILGKSFMDACKWLEGDNELQAADLGLKTTDTEQSPNKYDVRKYARFFEHPYLNPLASDFLFQQRHLNPRVIQRCRLTSWKEWLQIPYYDIDNQLVGVQWRYLGQDKSKPRFRFPYGSQCRIYNLPILKTLKPGEPLFISEGCSDCWSLLSSGYKAIAIPSATLLKPEDLQILKKLPLYKENEVLSLHIYPDADAPGELMYKKLALVATSLGACLTKHALPEGCKDFSEYYVGGGRIDG